MKQYLYIAFGCFVVAAVALLVLLSGCASTFESCWPKLDTCQSVEDCLVAIENKSCIPDEYECYQKSRDAAKCLKEHGYDAIPTCGPVKGLKRHHCWVEIKHGGEIYFYDPTWIGRDARYGCRKASRYTDRKKFKPYRADREN